MKIEICAELNSIEAQGGGHLPIRVRNEECGSSGCFFEGDNYERCNYLLRREIWILVSNPGEREDEYYIGTEQESHLKAHPARLNGWRREKDPVDTCGCGCQRRAPPISADATSSSSSSSSHTSSGIASILPSVDGLQFIGIEAEGDVVAPSANEREERNAAASSSTFDRR